MNFFDILFLILVLIVGHGIAGYFSKKFPELSKRRLLILFYYHLAFSILYFVYISIFGGDSVGYWKFPFRFGFREGDSVFDLHAPGSVFVHFLVFPLSQVFKISLFVGSIIFSLFGYLGLIYFYLTITRTIRENVMLFGYPLVPLVLFLPNIHFWSSGVGKDSVIFFALALFVFAMTRPAQNIPGIIFSFYLCYFLRPHIALLMIVGLGFALLTSTKGISLIWRVVFLSAAVYFFVVISPSVFEFIGLEQDNTEEFEDISDIRSKNLSRGSVASAIDISNYNTPQKILTFFFRPFFFDSGNVFGLVVSVENLFYAILFLSYLRMSSLVEIIRMPSHLKASLLIMGATAFFMSSSLSNLGIIIRQKNMVMFMFLLIALYLKEKHDSSRRVLVKPVSKLHNTLNEKENT